MPQQARRSLEEIFGAPAPMPAAPRPRRSLEEIFGGAADDDQHGGGFIDQLKNMSLRDWGATGTRLATGWLAGLPSMVPGVGTLVGAGIGGAGEGLAQLIGGEEWNPAAMGVAAGVGAIPMGKVFGAAGKAAAGAGLLERAGMLGQNVAGNAAKGFALNAGTDMAYRAAHGELPGRDYNLSEEVVPGVIGAGGGALTSILAARAAGAFGKPRTTAQDGLQGAFDFEAPGTGPAGGSAAGVDQGTLAAARAAIRDPQTLAAFDSQWGDVGAAPPARPRPAAPLTPGSRSQTLQDYAAATTPGTAIPPPGRRINQPPDPRSSADVVDDWFFGGQRAPAIQGERPVLEGMAPWQPGAAAPELAPVTNLDGPPAIPPGPWQVLDQDSSSVPAPIRELWESLQGPWAQSLAAQADDGIPFTVDQREPLEDFAARLMSDDPRQLMHQERQARSAVEAMRPPATAMPGALPTPAPVPERGSFQARPTARQRAASIIEGFIARAKAGPVPEGDDIDLLGQSISRDQQARAFAVEELAREFPLGDSFQRLPGDMQGALRRMLEEMRSFGFTPRTFNSAPGQGGTMDVVAGAAGTPLFHDIMAGRSGSRKNVINALARFIEGGQPPSPIARRAYEVALREAAGDPSLRKRMLPPDAGFGGDDAGFADPNVFFPIGGAATGAIVGPWVDDENPLRGAAVGAGAGLALGLGANRFLDDAGSVTTVKRAPRPPADRFDLGDVGGSDAGFVSPNVTFPLGGAMAGAFAGPLVDKDDADPMVSMIGGGGTGALLGLLMRSPQLVERMRSSGLFSGLAIPKSFLGNVGAVGAYAAEHPGTAADVVRETFSPETVDAAKEAFRRGLSREATSAEPSSPFSIPGRLIGAPDAAARDIIERVAAREAGALPGLTSPESLREAGRYTLSGDPRSDLGQLAIKATENPWFRLVAPVVRTPTNFIEAGLERTPFVGGMEDVRAWSGSSDALARRRQILGAIAAALGVGAGAATTEGGPLEGMDEATPFAAAAMGPYGLPFTFGKVATDTLMAPGNNSPLAALNNLWRAGIVDNLPLPSDTDSALTALLRPFIPYAGAMRQLSPVPPRDFETSSSYFGPALAQIPGLNEILFPLKKTAGSPPPRR